MNTKILAGAFAAAALLSAPALADGPQAITTAKTHAGFAAGGMNIGEVQRHLHHVLNCIVGPGGQGFDAMPGNPCNAAGGAIPQTADAATKAKLENAATMARNGIAATDVNAAKKAASDIQGML
jgi:hypothetical protein